MATLVIHSDIPSYLALPTTVLLFTTTAGGICFAFTRVVCTLRIEYQRPVLGAARASLIGLITLWLSTVLHAAIFPGASGVIMSIIGQLVMATLFFGLVVAIFGAIAGFVVEKLLFAKVSNKSLVRD
jgi:hypothetical protein